MKKHIAELEEVVNELVCDDCQEDGCCENDQKYDNWVNRGGEHWIEDSTRTAQLKDTVDKLMSDDYDDYIDKKYEDSKYDSCNLDNYDDDDEHDNYVNVRKASAELKKTIDMLMA